MTDNELDVMLREHGTAWREEHSHRPAVDWTAVTESKRRPWALSSKGMLGVLAVAATAAAVIVPLAVVGGPKSAAKPNPADHKQLPLTVAERGAPNGFFAIAPPTISGPGGAFAYVQGNGTYSVRPGNGVAAATAPDAVHGYEAYRTGTCQSTFNKLSYNSKFNNGDGEVGGGPVSTVPAQVARSAMAVSPDGEKLAFVENRTINPATDQCVAGPQRLGVLNLVTRHVTVISTQSLDMIESMAWAPDSRHLALELVPGAERGDLKVGVHVIDTKAPEVVPFNAGTRVSELRDQPGGNGISAPVAYLHGQLVMLLAGQVRPVGSSGALGAPLITGLPASAVSFSIDPTGQHVLIVAGPYASTSLSSRGFLSSGYSNEQAVTVGRTYRWDNGRLTKLRDSWIDPAW